MTIGQPSGGNVIDTYLGGDSLPRVAERISNLLIGREFALCTVPVGAGSESAVPRSAAALHLRHTTVPLTMTTRPAPNRDDFRDEYRVQRDFDPATDALDLITLYDTASEAYAALRDGSHVQDRLAVTRVIVKGGGAAADISASSSITIIQTNGYGRTTMTTLTPRWVPFAARVEEEASFFDSLASLLDADQAAMTSTAARAAALRVRRSAKSEFTGQVKAA